MRKVVNGAAGLATEVRGVPGHLEQQTLIDLDVVEAQLRRQRGRPLLEHRSS
jgi:hypothetical protein